MTKITAKFSFGATGTTASNSKIFENGYIKNLVANIPNFTNAVTATIGVYDDLGNELWVATGIDRNGTFRPLSSEMGEIPVDYGYTIQASISGDAGGSGGVITVGAFVSRNKP